MATLLLVDRHEACRAATALALERAGHAVTNVSNRDELVEQCRAGSADAVLADLGTLGRRGADTLRILAREHPELPIIVLLSGVTGGGLVNDLRGVDSQRIRIIAKPVDSYRLRAAVVEAIAG
jgi:DNA-binding NtrC family response regulator